MRCNGKSERASILIVALFAIGVLAAIIASSLKRTTVDTSLAGAWTKKAKASEIAETGLQIIARTVLNEFNTNRSIVALLNTVQFGTSGGGQYGVIVADNDNLAGFDQDGDGSATTDADGIFRLVSSGEVGNAEQVIEAFYRIRTQALSLPGTDGLGALGLCANNASITRAANISGEDWNLPGYPCSGAHCNGSASGNPNASGVSYNAGTTVSLSGGTPSGTPTVNSNAGIDCAAWQTFLNTVATGAHSTFSASAGPFNAAGVATQFGTDVAPKIVVVSGVAGETVRFNGNLFGNGILIIRNCHVVFAGTFTYAGLILIEDEGGGVQLSGTSSVLGSTMVINASSADAQVEIDIKSAPTRMRYSTAGLGRASQALQGLAGGNAGTLELLAWRTIGN